MTGSLPFRIVPHHPVLSFILFFLIATFIVYLLRQFIVRLVGSALALLLLPVTALYYSFLHWLMVQKINFYLSEWRSNIESYRQKVEHTFNDLLTKINKLYDKVLDDEEFEELNNNFIVAQQRLQDLLDRKEPIFNQARIIKNSKQQKKFLNRLDDLFKPIEELLNELQERTQDITEILQLIKDSQQLKKQFQDQLRNLEQLQQIQSELDQWLRIQETKEYIQQVRNMTDNKKLLELLETPTSPDSRSHQDHTNSDLRSSILKLIDQNQRVHQNHIKLRSKYRELHDLLYTKQAEWQHRNLFVEFMVAFGILFLFVGVLFLNFQLLEPPFAELSDAIILGNFRISHFLAIIFIIAEFASGLFFFEFLGLTNLLPRISERLKGNSRRRAAAIIFFILLALALIESYLTYWRSVLLEQGAANIQPAAGPSFTVNKPYFMAVLGFIFPLILALLAVAIEPFLQGLRLIAIKLFYSLCDILLLCFRIITIILKLIPPLVDRLLVLIAFVFIYIEKLVKYWRQRRVQTPQSVA